MQLNLHKKELLAAKRAVEDRMHELSIHASRQRNNPEYNETMATYSHLYQKVEVALQNIKDREGKA